MTDRTGQPRFMPPHLFAMTLLAMALLSLIAGPELVPAPWHWLGLAPVAAGLTITVVSARQFDRAGTNIVPFSRSSALVTDGVFAWSRNPMYGGMILALTGLAVVLGGYFPWGAVAAFAVTLRYRFVAGEERLMHSTFGAAYGEYCGRVRRWI